MTMPSNKEMRILADEMVNRFLDEHERLEHEVRRQHAQLCDAQRQIDILAGRTKRVEKLERLAVDTQEEVFELKGQLEEAKRLLSKALHWNGDHSEEIDEFLTRNGGDNDNIFD